MTTRRSLLAGSAAAFAACSLPLPLTARPGAGLTPYRGEAEFTQALERWRSAAAVLQPQRRSEMAALPSSPSMNAAPAAKSSGAADAAQSITNVQTAGVDEGGIVKRAGEYLVILRRGRLFTVRIGGDELRPVAAVDAYAPGSDPAGAWYDELLIWGRNIVVVGYSYARGGTEIGLFELDDDGRIAHRATHHLRSFDYYSSRNYASRLVGSKLIFYSPTLLQPWGPLPTQLMPAWRRWTPAAAPEDFKRILPATRIYRSDDDFDPTEALALHTVTVCDLAGGEMRAESSAVLGPAGRVFYVSAGSVYVWTASWRRTASSSSTAFRLPLDGAVPSALKTAGVPTDALSFLEDDDAHLNVLLRESGRGEGMWGSEGGGGALALLRVPLAEFGDGHGAARREFYRRLPGSAAAAFQNRFVGAWLLWGSAQARSAYALRFAAGDGAPTLLDIDHGVERIEALGSDALLVGNAGSDLHLSAVRLGRGTPEVAGRHVQFGAHQGETRTHGFFFRATGIGAGLLGLPVQSEGIVRPGGVYHSGEGSAAVLFLRERDLQFSRLGALQAGGDGGRNDACKASCVDWYGNARPLFLGERVLALLGYELVEGRLEGRGEGERIVEWRRISFAPAGRGDRYSPFG